MSCSSPITTVCKPVTPPVGASLEVIVLFYQKHNLAYLNEQIEQFHRKHSLNDAIHYAALAINQNEKRFSHQRRLKRNALNKAKKLLVGVEGHLNACLSFDDLHKLLVDLFSPVSGLGPLYIYDTALRLGAYLKLNPQHVYLHAGTRVGARALSLDISGEMLEASDFPKSVQVLAPHEIEDFLCIYKAYFST